MTLLLTLSLNVSAADCFDLLAGQFTDAGDVCLEVNGDDLTVTYTTQDGWMLDETQLWVGSDLADMPQNRKGNPKIGNFPYKAEGLFPATSYSYTLSLSALGVTSCGSQLYVAAHAVVGVDNGGGLQTETGWSAGDRFVSRGSWATYSTYTVPCDDPNGGGGTGGCETAYAVGDRTLISLGITNSRWGWEITGVTPGSYNYPIYAGAGQNDLSKGTHVGTLVVSYTCPPFGGCLMSVTYDMFGGFELNATHLYVGSDHLQSIAPGSYGNIHENLNGATQDNFVLNLSGGAYNIVAHGVVCGE